MLQVDEEFRQICKRIIAENLDEAAWAAIESDDIFQTDRYEGGYDADECAFCFSYDGRDGNEYWFQLSLDEVRLVANGSTSMLNARVAS